VWEDAVLALGEQILSIEEHLPGDACGRRQQPEHRERSRRLAAPGLADEAESFPRGELDAHALHGVQLTRTLLELEPDVEVLDLEQSRHLPRVLRSGRCLA